MDIGNDTLLGLVLREWGTPVVSIVVGGLFASVLIPRWQARWSHNRAREQRRIAHYEAIAENFSLYITSWRRLMAISGLERDRPLSEREMDRKEDYIGARTEARDKLICEFAKAQLYFSPSARDVIDRFVRWDESNGVKQGQELPGIEEWKQWEDTIIANLRDDLGLAPSGRRR